jgi:hypothetical protein
LRKLRVALIVGAVLCLAIVGYASATYYLEDAGKRLLPMPIRIRPPSIEELHTYFIVRTTVSMINAGLSVILLIVYAEIYVRTRAQFTIGLVLFSGVLLVYALTSNPLLQMLSFRVYGYGLVGALPELFTTIAAVLLLYLSVE